METDGIRELGIDEMAEIGGGFNCFAAAMGAVVLIGAGGLVGAAGVALFYASYNREINACFS